MINSADLKPITGTFLAPIVNDTGFNNWGLAEWEANFRLIKSLGMDTVIVPVVEFQVAGHRQSALDPRNTTWPEDPNLLSMCFRLCDKYNLQFYLGGVCNVDNVYAGKWEEEIEENRRFYEMMLDRFGQRKCLHGLYVCLEAIPWQYHWPETVEGILTEMRRLAPGKKTLLSPSLKMPKGDMSTIYTPEEFIDVYGRMFDRLKGKLDYCAWQDKYNKVDCVLGEMQTHELDVWYRATGKICRRNGIGLWANVESFDRPTAEVAAYRQADYRTLIAKIQAASPHVDKLITFEYFTCMSPHAEWGSAGRLLHRYVEALGMDKTKIAWPEDERVSMGSVRS